jgi:hypothetical protein
VGAPVSGKGKKAVIKGWQRFGPPSWIISRVLPKKKRKNLGKEVDITEFDYHSSSANMFIAGMARSFNIPKYRAVVERAMPAIE